MATLQDTYYTIARYEVGNTTYVIHIDLIKLDEPAFIMIGLWQICHFQSSY